MKTFIYTTKHKTMLGDLHTPVSTYPVSYTHLTLPTT